MDKQVIDLRYLRLPVRRAHVQDEKRVRCIYGASTFLLRPDLHIVWRGDGPPADPDALAALATGQTRTDPGRQSRIA